MVLFSEPSYAPISTMFQARLSKERDFGPRRLQPGGERVSGWVGIRHDEELCYAAVSPFLVALEINYELRAIDRHAILTKEGSMLDFLGAHFHGNGNLMYGQSVISFKHAYKFQKETSPLHHSMNQLPAIT